MHAPSYGRKQNLRLCPPVSLRLPFKLASRIIIFFSRPVSLLQEILPFCAGGVPGHPTHRRGKLSTHPVPRLPALPRSAPWAPPPRSTHSPSRRAGSGSQTQLCNTLVVPHRHNCAAFNTAFIRRLMYTWVCMGGDRPLDGCGNPTGMS